MQQSDLFPDERLKKLKAGKAVVVSVRKKDSIELVLNIMRWKKINHMPVINNKIKTFIEFVIY